MIVTVEWGAAKTATVEHLQRMIRMNTVNPPGNELAVARYLDSTLKAEAIETARSSPSRDEPSRDEPVAAEEVPSIRGSGRAS